MAYGYLFFWVAVFAITTALLIYMKKCKWW